MKNREIAEKLLEKKINNWSKENSIKIIFYPFKIAEASNNTEFSDLSENEEQKNKTETKSTLSIVCPKCSCYPELRLIKDNSREILIDCENCGYRQEVSVISYLDQLKLLQVHNLSQSVVNYNCIKHNKIYQYFCVNDDFLFPIF